MIENPSAASRYLPVPSKCSSARPSGSITAWQLAHVGLRWCIAMRSRSVFGCSPASSSFSPGTSGGGGGGGVPRKFSSSHAPRTTGEVRFG